MKNFNQLCLSLVVAFIIISLPGCSNYKEEFLKEEIQFTDRFQIGESVPVDVVSLQTNNDNSNEKFYLVELKLLENESREITFRDIKNNNSKFIQVLIDSNGNATLEQGSNDQEINDFAINNYVEWCGNWHRGPNNYWQICTGDDCQSAAICINTVPRSCEQFPGTCPE